MDRNNNAHSYWFLIAETQNIGILQVAPSDEDACNQNAKLIYYNHCYAPYSPPLLSQQSLFLWLCFHTPLMPQKNLITHPFVLFFTYKTPFPLVKRKILTVVLQNCKKSTVKYSIEKPTLLYFVIWVNIFLSLNFFLITLLKLLSLVINIFPHNSWYLHCYSFQEKCFFSEDFFWCSMYLSVIQYNSRFLTAILNLFHFVHWYLCFYIISFEIILLFSLWTLSLFNSFWGSNGLYKFYINYIMELLRCQFYLISFYVWNIYFL